MALLINTSLLYITGCLSLLVICKNSVSASELNFLSGNSDENLTLLENIEIYNPIHFGRSGASMGVISTVNP